MIFKPTPIKAAKNKNINLNHTFSDCNGKQYVADLLNIHHVKFYV